VERADGKTFCNEICDGEYDKQAEQTKWLDELDVGDEVVVEQPSYRFRYYLTTVSEVTPTGMWAKGFPSVLFSDGECLIGKYKYLLLEPTDEILDKINLSNNRRLLKSIDWNTVDDDTVMDVWDLVYGG
jgi:hypothetical protein